MNTFGKSFSDFHRGKPGLVSARLVSKAQVADHVFQIGLLCPYIAHNCSAGQFVHMRVNKLSNDPFLCRPFSIYRARGDIVDIVFKVRGRGTQILSGMEIGSELDIIGPLGNGFPVHVDFEKAFIVAGGMGIAGLVLLTERLYRCKDRQCIALIGARSRDAIVGKNDLKMLGVEVYTATEDGTEGFRGTVTELLEHLLSVEGIVLAKCRIFACGPTPMLKAVAQIAGRYEISAYVLLEEQMACGVGACLGCACEMASSEGEIQYKMVCVDGPVFDSKEILWK